MSLTVACQICGSGDPCEHDLLQDTQSIGKPEEYFDPKTGLAAVRLADAVMGMGPLARGIDDRIWSYRHGVWVPSKDEIRDRCTKILGDRYRRIHSNAVEDIIAARVAVIHCDPVPEVINCRNGLLDWRTGVLRPHDPKVLSTVQMDVDWVRDAECPFFEKWLAEVVPADCVPMVWELIGYLAYSGNPLHIAVMLTGTGRNGKGTFLRVVKGMLGDGNISAASLYSITTNRFAPATLYGKTANIAGDIDPTYMQETAVFKAVTGEDPLQAERKGREPFDFTAWCVPLFSANKIPPSADTTDGYLSRWLVLPFPNSFEGREDRSIGARLAAELPGILAKGVRHLPALLDRGRFELSDTARDAKEDFARKVDQVRDWAGERAEVGSGIPFTARTPLYEDYKRWAIDGGNTVLKAADFYERIENLPGVRHATVMGTRGFKGVRLIITDRALRAVN